MKFHYPVTFLIREHCNFICIARITNIPGLVKIWRTPFVVISMKTGIQEFYKVNGLGFHRVDGRSASKEVTLLYSLGWRSALTCFLP